MPKKKKSKTAGDQHIWKEILIQPELFAPPIDIPDMSEDELAIIKEAKLVIQQLLLDRLTDLAFECFTPHQKKVLALQQTPERTYLEIADMLGINYTAVSHAIKGIKSKKHDKFHGGYEKKLRKLCQKDDYCNEYIGLIKQLRNNNPMYALEILIEYDDDPAYWKQFEFSSSN